MEHEGVPRVPFPLAMLVGTARIGPSNLMNGMMMMMMGRSRSRESRQ